MEKYPLETLIMLRDRRYQDALNNQRQKKLLVEQTVRELDKARSELDEYKKWKVLEIARRYEQIMLSVQTQKQLATFHEGIEDEKRGDGFEKPKGQCNNVDCPQVPNEYMFFVLESCRIRFTGFQTFFCKSYIAFAIRIRSVSEYVQNDELQQCECGNN